MSSKRLVIALGGNAITLPTEEGNVAQQFQHTIETMEVVADVLQAGHQVVLTHGNGPQVGNILRRSEIAAEHNVYPIPLELCVADTQGGMGYMITQCLTNVLLQRGIDRRSATVITTVLVDENHSDFLNPTKPIGIYYNEEEARRHISEDGWRMRQVPNRGWRRVVASPEPLEIIELELIRRMTEAGDLVVCCGGGGIPVVRQAEGGYRGVDAVIDKDRTAALLAMSLKADMLVILTGVPKVYVKFGQPDQQALDRLTATEARSLLNEGHFPTGSMSPKIEAGIDFVTRRSAGMALITDAANLFSALEGNAGTQIVADAA